MPSWATQELQTANFRDARLTKRLIRMVEDFAAQPTASVPQACGSWAATKAAYNFWDSDRVTPTAIRAAHTDRTQTRIASHATILVIQDTTEIDVTDHPATQDVGYLDHPKRRGLKVHSALAATIDGVPLGLLHQAVWRRDPAQVGKKHTRSQRTTAEKESQRWLTAFQVTQAALPQTTQVITIADREADLYDLFAAPRLATHQLLIRAAYNRTVQHAAHRLWEASHQSPVLGTLTTTLPRGDDRPARSATLQIRATTLGIQPPQNRTARANLATIPLQVVLVTEVAPPAGVKAVEWLLMTTLPVDTLEDAIQVIDWYRLRWLIERYHYVLKSGCQVEKLQLETAAALERALATYCIVAWRLLWLTYEARQRPDAPCTEVLAPHEWQALYCTIHRTPSAPIDAPPPLSQAVRWIAQLGGLLGRRGDGEPGVKVIWRGLRRLDDIVATWVLLHGLEPRQLDTSLMGNG
ncbi:MAG TPA: IS4 family transposase [Herpetosiphonaceae bacterium]